MMDGLHIYHDVETTGLRGTHDKIVEHAAVYVYNGEVLREWTSLSNPGDEIVKSPWSAKAFAIHKIPIEDVLAARPEEVVAEEFRRIDAEIRGAYAPADDHERHSFNKAFDFAFLRCVPWGLDDGWGQCVMLRAHRALNPGGKWPKLVNAASALGLEWDGPQHRALSDARMAFRVHAKLEEEPWA